MMTVVVAHRSLSNGDDDSDGGEGGRARREASRIHNADSRFPLVFGHDRNIIIIIIH